MNWFHKEDGGLMEQSIPIDALFKAQYVCAICRYRVLSRHELESLRPLDCLPYNDLPEDLQSAALEEML